MKTVKWGEFTWNDPNVRWASPSYRLEPGDPGYVPPAPPPKKPSKKRTYMASNPTPNALNELISAGEDASDGLTQHAVAIGVKQNTFADTRADLDALIAARDAADAAEGAQPAAYTALRLADSNAKGFIAAAVKVFSVTLGNDWSDAWVATGLPDQTVGVPRTQDARFAALGSLKAYLTANPTMEVSTPKVVVTAAQATTLHTALSNARTGVNSALNLTKTKIMAQAAAKDAFRERYRKLIEELGGLLDDDDPKWYDFGLIRPIDPSTPGVPANVIVTPIGGGKVLVQWIRGRRSNSSNVYRQIVGTDTDPVKVTNTEGTQTTAESLPAGATVKITVTGVNDAGEGPACEEVSVVVG